MIIAIAAAIALRMLLHEYCHCCMNIAIAAAIALRVLLHECYRCCNNAITAAATVITASVKAYISQTSIGRYAILPKYGYYGV